MCALCPGTQLTAYTAFFAGFDLSQFHRRFSQLGFSPSSEAASEGRSALLHFDSGPGSSSGANHDHGLQGSASLTSETADSASGSYHFHDKHRLEPLFDNTTSRNITTTAGKTVYLPCRVRSLADRTVMPRSYCPARSICMACRFRRASRIHDQPVESERRTVLGMSTTEWIDGQRGVRVWTPSDP